MGVSVVKIFLAEIFMNMRTHIRNLLDPICLTRESIIIDSHFTPPLASSQGVYNQYDIITADLGRIRRNDFCKIIAYMGHIRTDQLDRFTDSLRWLQIPSHGYNGFDKKSLYKNPDIIVTNVKDIFSEPIAQYCVTAFYVFNSYSFRICKNFSLSSLQIINDVTILIVGIGNIGMVLAEKCKKMGWTVYGVKRQIHIEKPKFVDGLCNLEQIDQVLPNADYVVNILPESNDSIGLYNINFFTKMKRTALFCNVGRKSAVIDEDLEKAVDNGIIRGAILDAHNAYKYNNANIILTGHSSSVSPDNTDKFNKFFGSQLDAFLAGKELQCKIPLK